MCCFISLIKLLFWNQRLDGTTLGKNLLDCWSLLARDSSSDSANRGYCLIIINRKEKGSSCSCFDFRHLVTTQTLILSTSTILTCQQMEMVLPILMIQCYSDGVTPCALACQNEQYWSVLPLCMIIFSTSVTNCFGNLFMQGVLLKQQEGCPTITIVKKNTFILTWMMFPG